MEGRKWGDAFPLYSELYMGRQVRHSINSSYRRHVGGIYLLQQCNASKICVCLLTVVVECKILWAIKFLCKNWLFSRTS